MGLFECQDLRGLRLLAQQSKFFPDAVRYFIAAHPGDFCVVPLGLGNGRVQSVHTIRQDIVAGVLGAHRICVWQIVHFAEISEHYSIGDGGHGGDFCGDAGNLDMAHARKEARCNSSSDRNNAKLKRGHVICSTERELRASIERLRQQLRLRNFYDDFARPCENQFFAGDFFDGAGIGL